MNQENLRWFVLDRKSQGVECVSREHADAAIAMHGSIAYEVYKDLRHAYAWRSRLTTTWWSIDERVSNGLFVSLMEAHKLEW